MFILDLYTVAELSYDIQIDVWHRQFETSIFTFKNKSFRGSLIRLKIRTMFKMKLLIKFITKMKTILIQLNLLFEIRHEELETYVTSSRTKTKNCDVNAWNPNELLYLILTKLDTGNNLYYFSHSLVRILYMFRFNFISNSLSWILSFMEDIQFHIWNSCSNYTES